MPELPHIIQSDNGAEFKGEVSELLTNKGIKQIFSSPYHPQSQGAVESFNGTFKRLLRRYLAQNKTKRWVDYVPDILTNYNSTIHSTTHTTPDKLTSEPTTEQLDEAHKHIVAAAKRSSSYAASFKDDLHIGNYVRVALETTKDLLKNKLSKRNMNPTYSEELYKIVKVIKPRERTSTIDTPIKYVLQALAPGGRGKRMPGVYYRLRLLKTVAPRDQIGVGVGLDPELERDEEPEPDPEPAPQPEPEPEVRRSTRVRKPNVRLNEFVA